MAGALVHPNSILASLAEADWGRMKASFSEVPLNHGDVLQHADEPLQQVYFLTVGVVSTVALFENGASVEMATTGAEGMVGIGAILGGQRAISQHVVQIPGKALAIDFDAFRR